MDDMWDSGGGIDTHEDESISGYDTVDVQLLLTWFFDTAEPDDLPF